jgi:hypothetical protein
MQLATPLGASALWVSALLAQSTPAPSVEINYPGPSPNRYINLTLDGILPHGLAVNGQGASGEMAGILLARLIETAGWGQVPEDDISNYLVGIYGDEIVTLPLSAFLPQSLDNRVWVVTERGGKPLSASESPLVIGVASGGVVTLRVKRVRHIRVTNFETERVVEDEEFGELSEYEAGDSRRTLWNRYLRVEGIPAMILTRAAEGRLENSAVLLSRQVSQWSDRLLLDFLAGSMAPGIAPDAAIVRGGEFTVVRLGSGR